YMVETGALLGPGVLDRLSRARPDSASKIRMGAAYGRSGFHAEALALLLPTTPEALVDDLDALAVTAEALACQGRAKEAVPFAVRTLGLGSIDLEFNPLPAARVLLKADKAREAMDAYPWGTADQEFRASFAAELSSGGFEEAALEFLENAMIGPETVLRSRVLARAKKIDDALSVLSETIEGMGHDGVGTLVQARGLSLRGHGKEVLSLLEPMKVEEGEDEGEDPEAAAFGPEPLPAGAILEKARILARLDRADEAEALLLSDTSWEVFETEPDGGFMSVVDLLILLGRKEKILGRLPAALSEFGGNISFLETLAETFEAEGMGDEAQDLYFRLFRVSYDDEVQSRTGERILDLARRLSGEKELASKLVAAAARLADRWQKTLVHRPSMFRDDSTQVPLLSLLGSLRARQGRAREARALLNRAWELSSSSPLEWRVLIHRVEAERVIGDDLSRTFFRIILTPQGQGNPARRSGIGEDLHFLLFAVPFCDPRWEEGIGPFVAPRGNGPGGEDLFRLLPVPFTPLPWHGPAPSTFRDALSELARGTYFQEEHALVRDATRSDVLRRALVALGELEGAGAWQVYADMARRGGSLVRETALAQLDSHPSGNASPSLVREMKRSVGDFEWQVRVAETLCRSPAESYTEEVRSLLSDPSARLRALGAYVLLRNGERDAVELLEGIATEPGGPAEARSFALTVLASLSKPEKKPLFLQFAASPDATLRLPAALGLHLLGDPEGKAMVSRELKWHLESRRSGLPEILGWASTLGGAETASALIDGIHAPGVPAPDLIEALGRIGRVSKGDTIRLLDTFPYNEMGGGGRLETFLDLLAESGGKEESREGLICLLEGFAPGAMTGRDCAKAARLARRAGLEGMAERFFRRARRMLACRRD
ncbi:MAG: hypothetical protein ACYTFG_17250, partial [Planctomycetota bacterium]